MADKSAIEWTDATWNPIRARNLKTGKVGWHCEHATTGCEFCYAEGFNKWLGTGLAFKPGHRKDIEIFLDEEMLLQPLRWKKPRMIFVGSMTDLFADFVTYEMLIRIFATMALTPWHIYQVLTKRAARMQSDLTHSAVEDVYALACRQDGTLADRWQWPLPNVWLGVSTERQQEAAERIPLLLQTPAAVRFISAEPLLGPIDLTNLHPPGSGIPADANGISAIWTCKAIRPCLDQVIVGGESGPGARPMHPDWPRSLRNQCAGAGVAFFFKQWGEWLPGHHYTDELKARDSKLERSRFACMDWEGDNAVASDGQAGWDDLDEHAMYRVGKKAAGRLLDGVEHNGMPVAP